MYLLQPRSVLPNLVCSRMNTAGWGDVTYGIILYVLTQGFDPLKIAAFVFFAILMAVVFTSVRIIYHSLTFFLGNAEKFAGTVTEMIIMFILYPGSIFSGPSTWILHTIIPSALVAWIPAELFVTFDLKKFIILMTADVGIIVLSILIFKSGLRKYSSGNRMGTRL